MHFDTPDREPDDHAGASWWRELTPYQWFVFLVASLGWLFDTMDQQLFTMARKPAVTRLLDVAPGDPTATGRVDEYGGYATTVFMIGWAIGGIVFGILGDKVGRAKTMMMTVLFYSAFTGLSALSTGIWDFAFYRFLTGLGVGGQFAVGVALVAEVMSDRARPFALGWLQRSRRSATCWRPAWASAWADWKNPGQSPAPGDSCSWSAWPLPSWPYRSSSGSRSPSGGRPRCRRRAKS